MKKPVPALMQEVDAITHSSENIAFIKAMLTKHSVPGVRRNDLFRQLRLAEHRISGRGLRVAILGEFSSGKSTFINALLGQRLLKSARVATTASATYITYGPKLKVTATFLDGSCIQAVALDTARLSNAIARIRSDLPQTIEIREAINLLTTDQAIANAVKHVDITLPSQALQKGLSIIDTPGIGAGEARTQSHVQITQSVIDKSADAVIVLIPSAQPMSNTLITFLQESAHHFLHRCIFVITAMDTQTPQERQKIWSFVTQCFIKKLNLQNPKLYECAAIAALPIPEKIPTHQRSVWTTWQQQFINLEAVLFREIVRQRNLIISEKLVNLFQALLLEVEQDIQTRQIKIEADLHVLTQKNQVGSEALSNHNAQKQRLIKAIKDIDCDIGELAARQQQLKALNTKLRTA